MLCSKCGAPIRPVVAVDIDGTLGDYHSHFLKFACDYFGWNGYADDYNGAGSFKEWWMMSHDRSEQDWHEIKLAYRQGGMKRSMPIFVGATSLIREIREHDTELWVTTTRPYLSLDNIVPDTVEWLHRHGIEYEGMLFDEDKYSQLVERVDSERIVAVIDDLIDMCYAADEAVGRSVSILMGTEWNRAIRERRSSMWQIVAGIGPLIEDWKEKNGSYEATHEL